MEERSGEVGSDSLGGMEQQVHQEVGVLNGNSAGLDAKGKEVAEVLVDCDIKAKDGCEDLCAKHVFNECNKGANVRDDVADVLPLCHAAADKYGISRVR